MKARPEWITPLLAAGEAYIRIGDRQKALNLLETAEKQIAGNPDYDQAKETLSEMLKELRGR